MPSRLLSVVIVLFWLASMGWLCAVVWAPPESRMAQVDAREVYSVFFNWNESTAMTLLENGVRRGQITIAGGSGEDPDTGVFTNSLSLSGTMESRETRNEDGSPQIDLFWRGLLDFSKSLGLQSGNFSVRVPTRQLSAHFSMVRKPDAEEMEVSKESFDFKARAVLNQQPLFEFDSLKGAGNALPLHLLPMKSMIGIESLDPQNLEFEAEARMGKFTFGGRDLRAYLLILRRPGSEESVRVFLSEVGEPLKLETDYGFEAISEMLVPLNAYSGGKEANS